MTFDGLNEYLRKNKKNPLLFIFPGLILMILYIIINPLLEEGGAGGGENEENEWGAFGSMYFFGIFFLLLVAPTCYIFKENIRIKKYIETNHFQHWIDARIIQSVYYHATNSRHSQAMLILSMNNPVGNPVVAGTIATAQVISVAVPGGGGGGEGGGGGGGGGFGYPPIQPMQQPMQQPDAPQIEMYQGGPQSSSLSQPSTTVYTATATAVTISGPQPIPVAQAN